MRGIGFIATAIILVLLVASCAPPVDLSYDAKPEAVIVYADIQPYPGAPPSGKEYLRRYIPRLRIWGDGLVFLDIAEADVEPPWQWSGRLSPDQMHDLLVLLDKQGIFATWKPDGPNPAGTWFRMGAHLKTFSVEYESGNLRPTPYAKLIDSIMPKLKPVTLQSADDLRVQSVLVEVTGYWGQWGTSR